MNPKEQRLIAVIAGALGVSPSSLHLETRAEDLTEWDSVAQVNVISEVEAEFGVSIPIERIAELKAVRDFVPFLGQNG